MSRKEELRNKTVWRSDPHTLVKHLVYRHYLACWMPKILQRFPAATVVDAFAGPGVYEDGPDGSPRLVAKAFLEHAAYARFGELRIVCLEQRADRVARLRDEIARLGPTPKLTFTVLDPGEFADQQEALAAAATGGDAGRPVLWLLDPFNIKALPFDQVAACLSGRYHEAVITFFTEEMHRFCTQPGFSAALDEHFGSTDWRGVTTVAGQAARKEALVSAYRHQLESLGVLTEQFGVRVRNATPRYSLIFATHSQHGLQCWNPVKWKLDSYSGSGASADMLMQPDLFGTSLITELQDMLRGYAGTEQAWAKLAARAARTGYLDRHLREALDGLATDGLAIRVAPVDARTPWPEGSIIRFYAPEDIDDSDPRQALAEP
ncbi:three-Cys-motif partner protein TcmP [Modestobacter sp. SYSU DS0875]